MIVSESQTPADGADEKSPETWKSFGKWLERQRVKAGLTKRQIAGLAEVSASTWSNLEAGGRNSRGDWILPSPESTTLVRIAKAVGASPSKVFEMVGRQWHESLDMEMQHIPGLEQPKMPAALVGKFGKLKPEQRALVEQLVDQLLGEQEE